MWNAYESKSWVAWLAILIACVELPQRPERAATAQPDAGAESPAAQSGPSTLRIGSWNLRKYGFEGQKDSAAIARILEANFDLVALLEVVWTPEERALRELAQALGPSFALSRTSTPRPNASSPYSEYYVVAYRRARVAPCAERPELTFFADGDGSDNSPTRGLFLREPAFACYRVLGRARAFDFVLGVYHAEWGEGQARSIASEVAHIDSVFAAMRDTLADDRALYMLGDFNLTPAQLAPLTAAYDRTEGSGSTLDAQGNISTHLYDHLLALGAAANAALVADAQVLDVRAEALDPRRYREQVSDHLPIMAELNLQEDDD